jgi:sugar (pentulose or hexulose) kinase
LWLASSVVAGCVVATRRFFGATLNHGRGHFVRAVLDGLALNLRLLDDGVAERRGGQPLQTAVLVGGGTRSNVLMQTIADTLQCEVRVSPFQQIANCLGAAICAVIGHGMLGKPADAQPPAANPRVHAPDAHLAADSAARVQLYRSLHDRFKPAFADLAALQSLQG